MSNPGFRSGFQDPGEPSLGLIPIPNQQHYYGNAFFLSYVVYIKFQFL